MWWQTSALPTSGGDFPMVSETQVLEGIVVAELPQQLFQLESAGGDVIASPSTEQKRLGLSLRTGQRVRFRTSERDPSRGIILGVLPERVRGHEGKP